MQLIPVLLAHHLSLMRFVKPRDIQWKFMTVLQLLNYRSDLTVLPKQALN